MYACVCCVWMYSCMYECARLKVHRVIEQRRRTRRGEKEERKEDTRMQAAELRSSGLTYRKLVYVFSNCRVAEGTDTRGSRILLMRVEKTITSNHCTLTRELTKILFSTVQMSSPSPLIYLFNGELCDSEHARTSRKTERQNIQIRQRALERL